MNATHSPSPQPSPAGRGGTRAERLAKRAFFLPVVRCCLIAIVAFSSFGVLGQGESVAVLFNSALPESRAVAEH